MRIPPEAPQLKVNTFAHPPPWGAYITYPPGAVVSYHATIWRCESSHTSWEEPAGAPSSNLAFWTPIGVLGSNISTSAQQVSPPSYSQSLNTQAEKVSPYPTFIESSSSHNVGDEKPGFGPGHSGALGYLSDKAGDAFRGAIINEEENESKHEDNLKDEVRGKRFWRVGGVGIWAYGLDRKEESTREKLWREWSDKHDEDDWINISRKRTKFYNESGGRHVRPLFSWKLVEKGERLPVDALPIGNEQDGAVLYAARAWHQGGVHLGKAGHHLHKGASIPYGGGEISFDTYEVFCGSINEPHLVKWMTFPHGQIAHVEGWQPVEGGREKDGRALLLAKGFYDNGQHPGKIIVRDDHACVGYGGGEVWVRPYQILAYADPRRR
ncbi:uncharacterized protein IAS62_001773 [Cryptococcus decagattii]|uniref:Uncharacterized protein n=1 Tax=Cryptococcus decagattii TaxID=1859122 RepID=A0ABZ2ATE5_9TREE